MRYRPSVVDLVLDHESPIPLYHQLKQHIVHLISSGGWQPGTAVPSVRQLANDLQMSTATVQRAYNELQSQGLLVGRPGRGVFVGELATGVSQHPAERTEMLRALFTHAALHARSLGFDTNEAVSVVRALMGDNSVPVAASRVVFVGAQPEFVEKYRALLREALGHFDLQVDGVLLSDLAHHRVDLDAFGPIRAIVSLIGTFADVRRLVSQHGVPLYGLVVDLTEATQRALVRHPAGEPLALVTERIHLPSARALLRQYVGSEEGVRWGALGNRTLVRRLVGECPTVVHTLGAKHLVEELAGPNTQLIELQYLPNEASLARLVEMVAKDDLANLAPDLPIAAPLPEVAQRRALS